MLISEDVKLDYSDVLIRPKRSTLKTRASVDIERRYQFRNSKREWSGVPIMAANMDTVGTFKMHEALAQFHVTTCIAKALNTEEDWQKIAYKEKGREYIAIMAGISDEEMNRVVEEVKFNDSQRDYSYDALTKDEKNEIALFHSMK